TRSKRDWSSDVCSSDLDAQQPTKIPRVGFLSGSGDLNTPGLQTEAFRQGLRDLGYIEGKNILVEYRYVEGKVDRIPSLVGELMRSEERRVGKECSTWAR